MAISKLLTKKKPEKKLLATLKRRAGRGTSGRITVRHKGGGVKKRYRLIDFGQQKLGQKAKIVAIEYDPYRTSFIALVEYDDGDKRYIIYPHGLQVGDIIAIGEKTEIKPGNRTQLKNMPSGTQVHNIEMAPGMGGKMVRGAGTSATVIAQDDRYTHLEMPSGEARKILSVCYATIGSVSRPEWKYAKVGKAGTSRRRGIAPSVRGAAMNPVDHPHGGGEGRAPVGLKGPKTPWGKKALGVKTRKKKKWTNTLILRRRKKKKKK